MNVTLIVLISHTADTLSHQVAVGPSPPSVNLLQFGAHDSHKMHEGAPALLGQADTQAGGKVLFCVIVGVSWKPTMMWTRWDCEYL